jgi:ABC-2 type transport system permease protein
MSVRSSAAHWGEVYRVQLKNNWVREAVYRTNFLTAIATDIIWIIIEFSLFSVIYANVHSLGGWTLHQVYFFLGVFFASDALFTVFFQRNFWNFSDLINKGELDILLTKPISPVFLALSRWMNLSACLDILLGFGIMIRYGSQAGFAGGWQWLMVGVWLLLGLVTAVLVRFAFSIWVFWTDRSWAISRLYYQFFQIATKPDTIYPRLVRYMVLTALPFAFIASVPARALMIGLRPMEYGFLAGVIVVFGAFNVVMWRKGLRRYQSASS